MRYRQYADMILRGGKVVQYCSGYPRLGDNDRPDGEVQRKIEAARRNHEHRLVTINKCNVLLGACRGAPGWNAVAWMPRTKLAVPFVAGNLV